MYPSFARYRNPLACTVLAFVLAACATLPPPTGEISAAQQSLTRAEGADADQYATQDIANARRGLEQAQAAMAEREYEEARRLALAAAADADLAYARSREALVTSELERRRAEIAELQDRLQTEGAP